MNLNNIIGNWRWKLSLLLFCLFTLLAQFKPTPSSTLAEQSIQLNYLALGDSLTVGLGASEVNYLRLAAFVPQLTNHLRQTQSVHVENHALPGLTSAQFEQFLQQGLGVKQRVAEADLITITIGGNDFLQLLTEDEITAQKIEDTLEKLFIHLEQALSFMRQQNPEVAIYIMDLYTPYDDGHPLSLLSQEVITTYNHRLRDLVAHDKQLYLVSVYHLFLGRGHALTHISKGNIHPNDEGYKIIFEAFRENIVQ